MHHYIALVWSRGDAESASEATRLRSLMERASTPWTKLVDSAHLLIYSLPAVDHAMRAYVLPGATGAIFGRLFSEFHVSPPEDLNSIASCLTADRIVEHLSRDYWGNYVAIVSTPDDVATYIARDSSGGLPCFYIKHHRVHIFFSSLSDVICLGLPLTVSPEYLARTILQYPLHLPETALHQVRDVLAGDCVAVLDGGNEERYSIWRPQELAMHETIDDYLAALSTLKAITEDTIAAWASVHSRILVHLSGGLDSAIVLGCLRKRGLAEKVVCVNHFTPGTRDDEREHARAAARMAGIPLIELSRLSDGEAFFRGIHTIPVQPKPDVSHLARVMMVGQMNHVAAEFDCTTVWTGQGGDQLFLCAPHPYGAADYLFQHRLPWKLGSAIYDTAVLDRDSIWAVLLTSIRYGLDRRPKPLLADEFEADGRGFLASSAIPIRTNVDRTQAEGHGHRLPPGKRMQIRDLTDLANRHKPLVGLETPFEQHPLISQPLLAASLRIPTYLLQKGGRHRAMARDAFADRVPVQILQREDKGDIVDHIRTLLRNSGSSLREVMLDGYLVGHGIVERAALERVLLGQETYRVTEMFPLLSCIAAEMWTRNLDTLTRRAEAHWQAAPALHSVA